MQIALKTVRYVLAWPRFLGWLFPLLAVATFFGRDLRLIDDAVLTCTLRDWFTVTPRSWRAGNRPIFTYSVTLAAGMCLHPWSDARVLEHERVHVRQLEDLAISGIPLAIAVCLVGWTWWGLAFWPGAMLLEVGNYLGAVLRGGDVYRDAEHERSAFAQTDLRPDGSSWLGDRVRGR